MKKFCYVVCVIVLLFSLVSCGQKVDSGFTITKESEEYIGKSNDEMLIINNSCSRLTVASSKNEMAAQKINKFLNEYIDSEWKIVCDETDSQVQAINEYNIQLENALDYYGINIATSKLFENEKYISFVISQDGSMGGVGWNSVKEFNFDKSTGELLDIHNIVGNAEAFESQMYEYCIDYIKNQTDFEDILWNDEISGNWEEILKNQMFANGSWGLIDAGIEFVFEKYVLGPGAVGTIIIDVPYKF